MKISEILKQKKTFSFEVFPPKMQQRIEPVMETLDKLYTLKPDYISCTYGAGGTNKGRSLEICGSIGKSGQSEALAHFTCIGNTKEDILSFLSEYGEKGVENVLALRGDLPAGWEGTCGDFQHADELIAFILEHCPNLCIGAAAYPESHLLSESPEADIRYLKQKQLSGASFCVTQLCNNVDAFSRFLDLALHNGVTLPVIAGVMPVLNMDAMVRMTLSNGCTIPKKLADICGKYGKDPDDFKRAGKDYTVYLIDSFRALGVDGIHVYSMNRYYDVYDIVRDAGLV